MVGHLIDLAAGRPDDDPGGQVARGEGLRCGEDLSEPFHVAPEECPTDYRSDCEHDGRGDGEDATYVSQ